MSCYMKSNWNLNHLAKRWKSRLINVKTVEISIIICLSDLWAHNAKTLWRRVFRCEMRPREMDEFVEQDMGWYRARFQLKYQTCNEFADGFTALTLHFEMLQPSSFCSFFMYEYHRLLSLVAPRVHMRTKFKAKATDDFKLSGLAFKRWHSEIISRTYRMGGDLYKCRVHLQRLWFWVKVRAVICATREFIKEISPRESASKVGHFICTRFGWLESSRMKLFLHSLDMTRSTFKINANWIRE